MPAIYTAGSRSLAVLEILVHYAVLPRDFVMTPVEIPYRVRVEKLPLSLLPGGWRRPEAVRITQAIGKDLLARSAVLRVPSAIVPEENNYVLNPEHPDFKRIRFLAFVPFRFDARLR